MANSTLAAMTAATSLAASDIMYSVVDPSGTPLDRKITAANVAKTSALLGAGALNNIASATPDLSAATTTNVTITGTTTITAFGTVTAGAIYTLTFADAVTLTHNGTSLILPSGANVTTAAGDVFTFQSLGSGNWRCISYALASGEAIVGGAGGGSADATVTGTDDAATDLAALNAAITAVAASSTAPKTIAIVGTFAMGATRPSQLQYITLDLTRAYMKQTANFTDAAPWLRGIGMNIIGGKFGTSLGAVGASNSILFGDTGTAGDGPAANFTGILLDATWDTLTAARTVVSFANTGGGACQSFISIGSLCQYGSSNRCNVSFDGRGRTVNLAGCWGSLVTGSGSLGESVVTVTSVGGTAALTGDSSTFNISNVVGAITSMNGTYCRYSIAHAGGAVTTGAGLQNVYAISIADSTISTASSDGCNFTFGTVTGVLTASGTDGVYNIGTLVAASQVLSGANNTYNIGEVSSSITCSGTESNYTISKLVGAGTFSATKSNFDVATADSTITTASGDGCTYRFGTVTGVLTASGTDSAYQIGTLVAGSQVLSGANNAYSIGEVSSSITISGSGCDVRIGEAGDLVIASGDQNCISVSTSSNGYISATNSTESTFEFRATGTSFAPSLDIGTRCSWTVLSGLTTGKISLSSGVGSRIDITTIGDGADIEMNESCDSCIINAVMTGSSSQMTIRAGYNNVITMISDVTPSFFTTEAQCINIVYWQRYSTTVNYPMQLVSYKGPNRAAMPITLAMVTALGAATSGQIAFTTLPASKRVNRAFVLNGGGAAATIATLTASIGPTGSATDILTASTVFAANAVSDTLGATLTQSYTAGTALVVQLVADANLNTTTGLASGLIAVCEWS